MPATLPAARRTWQGVWVSPWDDWQERPLGAAAQRVTKELRRLGKRMPATVLIAAMERRGVEDPSGLLLDALDEAPWAFLVHDGR
jgi:hypothetical protein